MTVIYKRQTIEQALRESQTRRAQWSSQRNLTSRQCSRCFLSFETLRKYPKQICILCRWELKVSGDPDLVLKGMSEEDFYAKHIAKGIDLQRKKERAMKAGGVTFHRVLSDRIKDFTDLLDS